MRRFLLVLALALFVVLSGCRERPPAPVSSAARVEAPDPLAVLHAWDDARALAWERGDLDALAALYEPGSRAGAADVALLRRYRERGVRVSGVRMQVLAARAVVRSADRLRVEVVERFAGATVGGAAVPGGTPVLRQVELRRHGNAWLVAEVRTLRPSGPR